MSVRNLSRLERKLGATIDICARRRGNRAAALACDVLFFRSTVETLDARGPTPRPLRTVAVVQNRRKAETRVVALSTAASC